MIPVCIEFEQNVVYLPRNQTLDDSDLRSQFAEHYENMIGELPEKMNVDNLFKSVKTPRAKLCHGKFVVHAEIPPPDSRRHLFLFLDTSHDKKSPGWPSKRQLRHFIVSDEELSTNLSSWVRANIPDGVCNVESAWPISQLFPASRNVSLNL